MHKITKVNIKNNCKITTIYNLQSVSLYMPVRAIRKLFKGNFSGFINTKYYGITIGMMFMIYLVLWYFDVANLRERTANFWNMLSSRIGGSV